VNAGSFPYERNPAHGHSPSGLGGLRRKAEGGIGVDLPPQLLVNDGWIIVIQSERAAPMRRECDVGGTDQRRSRPAVPTTRPLITRSEPGVPTRRKFSRCTGPARRRQHQRRYASLHDQSARLSRYEGTAPHVRRMKAARTLWPFEDHLALTDQRAVPVALDGNVVEHSPPPPADCPQRQYVV
jgi:hypothetical protein